MEGSTAERANLSLSRVMFRVRRNFPRRIKARIGDGQARLHLQRKNPCPSRKGIVFLVVDHGTGADFGGEFIDGHAQHRRCLKLTLVWLAGLGPASRNDVFGKKTQGFDFLVGSSTRVAVPSTTTER